MLKREIKFENFDGEMDSEICYFNLSKAELFELEIEFDGIAKVLLKIVEDKNNQDLIAWFKKFILSSYGEKSADGKSFLKSDEISKRFEQTAAYQSLFIELLEHDDLAESFLVGIMPKDMQAAMKDQDKPTGPPQARPTPPVPPTS